MRVSKCLQPHSLSILVLLSYQVENKNLLKPNEVISKHSWGKSKPHCLKGKAPKQIFALIRSILEYITRPLFLLYNIQTTLSWKALRSIMGRWYKEMGLPGVWRDDEVTGSPSPGPGDSLREDIWLKILIPIMTSDTYWKCLVVVWESLRQPWLSSHHYINYKALLAQQGGRTGRSQSFWSVVSIMCVVAGYMTDP